MKNKIVAISDFVKRQTKDSEFTHFDGSWEELVYIIISYIQKGDMIKGYRDGVNIIPLHQDICKRFYTYTNYPMFEGMKLKAEYRKVARREHEPPKIKVTIEEPKMPCNYVDVIIYHHDVLKEDNDVSSDAEWEVVSINGRLNKKNPPMDPMTIVRNWKHLPGGTEMKGITSEEVLEMLCTSILYENGIVKW